MSPEEAAAKLFYDYKALLPTRCDIYHFFNTINHSKKQPWVISVESAVPWPLNVTRCVESVEPDFSVLKHDKYIERALYYLSLENCKGLLALSHCSMNIQEQMLKQFPQYERQISSKLITLTPPQTIIVDNISEKPVDYHATQLTFIFVGMDFFRKGGREMLRVLIDLHKSYDFRLVLITKLRVDEKRYLMSDRDEDEARSIIFANEDWIEFHEYLPNAQVLEKVKAAHVALLPTWMDTYGYSVLECQACGTPVISTSLRALTEENNENVGWLVKVPVNELNNPIHNTVEQREKFSNILVEGLKEKIEYVLTHREEIENKAIKCLEKIARYHSPEKYARNLSLVYAGRISEVKNKLNKNLE